MPLLPASRLAGVLTRRSRATVSALVADCYGARGWTVTPAAGGFDATNPQTGRTERVVVLGARTSLTAPARVDADVVVARRDAGWARSVAAASGARFLGPAELRETLLYGLGRDRARELVDEHLGVSLAREPAPLRAETLAVAAALLVVVAGTAGGVVGLLDSPAAADPGADAPSSTTPRPDADTTATAGPSEPNTVSGFPPGLDDDGVDDVQTLAEAHAMAVGDKSYSLSIDGRRSTTGEAGESFAVRRTVTVEDRTRYTVVVEATQPGRTINETEVRYAAYADGARVLTRTRGANGTPVYASRPITPDGENPFTRVTSGYLSRYLDGNESDLSRVTYRGRLVYIVSVVSQPRRLTGNVSDYRADAVLYPDGFVLQMEVSYNVTTAEGTRQVDVSFAYEGVGETEVTEPQWVDEARENTTDPGGNESGVDGLN